MSQHLQQIIPLYYTQWKISRPRQIVFGCGRRHQHAGQAVAPAPQFGNCMKIAQSRSSQMAVIENV